MQSKRGSLIESVINTFIGFLITCAVAPLIYYLVDVKMTATKLGLANAAFTLVSVIRNYIIRRFFNRTNIWVNKNKEK